MGTRFLVLPDSTADLLVAYQSGDARAFCEFHSLLRPLLAAHLLSLGADKADLEPLLDQVFLQIHAARRTWRPGSPVAPWVMAIARHVFRTAGRFGIFHSAQLEASHAVRSKVPGLEEHSATHVVQSSFAR